MNEVNAPSGNLAPHRGTLILVFGVLGLVVCCIFGLLAWIMGRGDLAQMNAGTMDREGESLTRVGGILGIVSVVLFLIALVVFILLLAGGLLVGVAGNQ